jgi:hypothetical protein
MILEMQSLMDCIGLEQDLIKYRMQVRINRQQLCSKVTLKSQTNGIMQQVEDSVMILSLSWLEVVLLRGMDPFGLW